MKVTFISELTKRLLFTSFLVLIFLWNPLLAQPVNDFGFTRSLNFPKCFASGSELKFPWAGGLNSCQFNAIDLNFDQKKDLVVFDRNGNRLLTFINQGDSGSVNYLYEPQYEKFFPNFYSWLILKDYNNDGKEDIFTYGFGGIKIFKNTSDPVNGLSFELITNQLLSYMYNGYVNVYVTDVDYPAIEDIDGDGDLDILAFWILGTYIHYHQNLSMEEFGTCDSLKYRLKTSCWGYIKEGDTSNHITLNAPCPSFKSDDYLDVSSGSSDYKNPESVEHVGSTLLSINLNADSLQDLILGDVDYPGVIGLTNGGNPDTARIISQDASFPAYDTSIKIFSFPVITSVDVNNDGKLDLLASPFDPSSIITRSHESVWMYEDLGINGQTHYHLRTKSFLQGDMIDVGTSSMPVFCDIDQDGLTDIVLGNYGFYDSSYYQNGFLHSVFKSHLSVLRNTGTPTVPAFSVDNQDFASVSALNITNAYPAFGDLDADGDLDMLLGNSSGTLFYFQNVAGSGNPLSFASPVAGYQGIDVGNSSTPQLWDLDKDGKLDLIIGNKKGLLSYYHNTGTPQLPVFTWQTDSLGKVDVRDPSIAWDGNSVPCFFSDINDSTCLFVGSLKGGVSYYKNIDGNMAGTYNPISSNYLFLRYGDNSAMAVNDLDHDGFLDLIMGNTGGGLAYFKGTDPTPIGFPEIKGLTGVVCRVYPNPAKEYCLLDISGNENFTMTSYSVFNLEGCSLFSGNINSIPARVECPQKPGIYYIYLTFWKNNLKYFLSKPLKLVVIQ